MKYLKVMLICVFILSVGLGEEALDIEKYRERAVEKWEDSIQTLERLDQSETHPDDSILFVGSSSIRRWDSIVEDIAPYHPIQRGFGGSRFSDLVIFAERLIKPHKFRAVVIFVANDIAGKEIDKTPAEVAKLFSYFRDQIRKHNPKSPIFYIAVTPAEARATSWPKIKGPIPRSEKSAKNHRIVILSGRRVFFLILKATRSPIYLLQTNCISMKRDMLCGLQPSKAIWIQF